MNAGILVFPGSNCDHDAYHVLKHTLDVETRFIWHKERDLSGLDLIIVPGGFSYGDYLRSGAIARFSPVMEEVAAFAKKGGLVFGICNGFQILLECGLLPGGMLHNESLRFTCKDVFLKTVTNESPYTSQLEVNDVLRIPVAHGEGNYYASPDEIQRLFDHNQVIFQYCDKDGNVTPESSPNGAAKNIAGICNASRNVLGMMPHPERASDPILGNTDGLGIFESILHSFSQHA
jgi:phosphoribosylformylglycinamidine synthase I